MEGTGSQLRHLRDLIREGPLTSREFRSPGLKTEYRTVPRQFLEAPQNIKPQTVEGNEPLFPSGHRIRRNANHHSGLNKFGEQQ